MASNVRLEGTGSEGIGFLDKEEQQKKGELKGQQKGYKFRNFDGADKKGGCDWKAGLKWTAVAFAILGVVAGVVGLLVYLGQLQLGLTGVGAMSAATGLYVMLAGFGVTFITGILLGVSCILGRAKEAKEGEKKPWTSCTNLCSGDKKAKKKDKLGL